MKINIINKLELTGDEKVLDVGCGKGLMINGAAQRLKSGKAYGIDIWSSKDQSRITKVNGKIAILELANIEEYAHILKENGFKIKEITKNQYLMFPSVRILYATRISTKGTL